MRHFAAPAFWDCYRRLPAFAQRAADKSYALMKHDPRHPSLQFKKLNAFWSVRAGLRHRALAVEIPGGFLWFWIGTHAEYDRMVV